MIEEIFIPVKGFEGLYEVSNHGKVKSCTKYKGLNYSTFCPEKIMSPKDNGAGYMQIFLCDHGRKKHFYVHRLVALHFIPNPEGLPEVEHINSDKKCNTIWNLKWITRIENEREAYRKGEKGKAEKCKRSKPIIQMDREGNFIRRFVSATSVNEFGFERSMVSRAARGVIPTAYNYKWKYA